ncbi:hypothetical protein ACFWUP_25425 [Nocardia sp. NPDC058658]|uniref:hypothetical protein n=1 Tax=Nocardia sp. NPDC058658 TaxID=3346580 RepID=UPI00364D52CB
MFLVSALLLGIIGGSVVGTSSMAGIPLLIIAGLLLVGGIRDLIRDGVPVIGRSGRAQRSGAWQSSLAVGTVGSTGGSTGPGGTSHGSGGSPMGGGESSSSCGGGGCGGG